MGFKKGGFQYLLAAILKYPVTQIKSYLIFFEDENGLRSHVEYPGMKLTSPSNLSGPVEKVLGYLCGECFFKVGFHALFFYYFEYSIRFYNWVVLWNRVGALGPSYSHYFFPPSLKWGGGIRARQERRQSAKFATDLNTHYILSYCLSFCDPFDYFVRPYIRNSVRP